ncbi:MAG TPA: hypothetical protein VJ350_07580 [Methanoregula sp.]|nr:hypothetical protein [Methanoregula sp.]
MASNRLRTGNRVHVFSTDGEIPDTSDFETTGKNFIGLSLYTLCPIRVTRIVIRHAMRYNIPVKELKTYD